MVFQNIAKAVQSVAAPSTNTSTAMPVLPPPKQRAVVDAIVSKVTDVNPQELLNKAVTNGLREGINNPSQVPENKHVANNNLHSGDIHKSKSFV